MGRVFEARLGGRGEVLSASLPHVEKSPDAVED